MREAKRKVHTFFGGVNFLRSTQQHTKGMTAFASLSFWVQHGCNNVLLQRAIKSRMPSNKNDPCTARRSDCHGTSTGNSLGRTCLRPLLLHYEKCMVGELNTQVKSRRHVTRTSVHHEKCKFRDVAFKFACASKEAYSPWAPLKRVHTRANSVHRNSCL